MKTQKQLPLATTASDNDTGSVLAQRLAQKTIKTRRAANDQSYWRKRLFHRYYAQDGKKVVVPDWYVRICYGGRRHFFNLETGNEDSASKRARDIYQTIVAEGWEAALAKFKPKPEAGTSMTFEEFADLYRKTLKMVEFPPSRETTERYIKSLNFIGSRVQLRKLAELTSEMIEKFRADYLAEARKEGRDENSIKTTINFHLRQAGSLFSRQMIESFQTQGVTLTNPFIGKKLRRVPIKAYSPLKRELLDRIWQDAARLRDGDPSAPKPVIIRTGGKKSKLPPEKKAKRWRAPDFHAPHPDAYAILLLELGLGFRRNEADKAEWEWFHTINDRHYVEVKETPYFKPKQRQRRVIPVEPLLYEAIQATRTHAGAWVVPGPAPKRYQPGKEPKNIVYRCDPAHRTLARACPSGGSSITARVYLTPPDDIAPRGGPKVPKSSVITRRDLMVWPPGAWLLAVEPPVGPSAIRPDPTIPTARFLLLATRWRLPEPAES